MLGQVSLRVGVYPLAIPDGPWLNKPAEYAETVARLGVSEEYILVAPAGSQDNRRLSDAQMFAVAEEWPAVFAHHVELPELPGLNLTGKTSLPELYALTAMARAVVAPDGGTLHLAGAFGTPVLAVIGNTLNPYSFCMDYTPSLWLYGPRAGSFDIAPEWVLWGLDELLPETT
jgi:ADP-heptose:LPS heptosyltransferase